MRMAHLKRPRTGNVKDLLKGSSDSNLCYEGKNPHQCQANYDLSTFTFLLPFPYDHACCAVLELKDLLALLHRQGPSTEGIFRLAASERASRDIREALDTGAQVHLASQPVHVLAVILKDFLRKIPSKLLHSELYQQWMDALQKTSRQERLAGLREPPEGVEGAQVTRLPSFKALLKELRGRNAATPLHAGSLERLLEGQAKDLLALLHEQGPSTEGIFRLAASERASRDIREALDTGAQVHLASQPVHVLAVILKDFLRKIPSKLLHSELYQQWMDALQKTSRQERLAGLREYLRIYEGIMIVMSSCDYGGESVGHRFQRKGESESMKQSTALTSLQMPISQMLPEGPCCAQPDLELALQVAIIVPGIRDREPCHASALHQDMKALKQHPFVGGRDLKVQKLKGEAAATYHLSHEN
ncbi:hypothetical protein Q9233_014502 [Columba guinea]|nr:hypothetical protein Q9233_014502 [Columba guinea]